MNNPIFSPYGGYDQTASTTSQDLPPALASILSMGSSAPMSGSMTDSGLSSGMSNPGAFAPSYQAGGMIGAGGMPEPTGVGLAQPGQMPGGPMSPEMMSMQLNQFANQRPEQMAQVKQVMMEAVQSGELTPQELNMMVQLATVASQNPEMYPYARKFAIQQGLVTEEDLPQQYDAGLIFTILLAARAVQGGMGGEMGAAQGMPPGMGAAPMQPPAQGMPPSMAQGGAVPQSRKSDGSVLINAHEGEYVIPANVVKMKGREFFDSMVEKYKGG